MIKSVLFSFLLGLACLSAYGQTVRYENMPCTYDGSGRITDSAGVSTNSGANVVCTIQADQMKLSVYKIGLCKAAPTFSYNANPDLSQCTIIFDGAGGNAVTITKSGGLTLPNLLRPANGTYTHFLFIHSNTIELKARAEFTSTRVRLVGTVDADAGNFCWTIAGGTRCGSSYDNSYDFNRISIETDDDNQGNLEATPFNGNTREYFTNSSLRLSSTLDVNPSLHGGTTSRWVNIFYPNTAVVISDLTRGLKLGINITAGAEIDFDLVPGTPRKIKSIQDAPFAYSVETLQ